MERGRQSYIQMQQRPDLSLIDASNPPKQNPANVLLDYNKFRGDTFMLIRFMFECGAKLNAQPMTISTAVILFHKFRANSKNDKEYDLYLIAAACLYLAGKIETQLFKLRDIINVTRSTLHRTSSPLELGEGYWAARESIVQAELLVIRVLKFDIRINHPQKFLVHYLRTLEEWMGVEEWTKVPVARTSWAFVQDFHHDSAIVSYPPQAIAVAAIELAMSVFGCTVPLCSSEGRNSWQSIFYAQFNAVEHSEIMVKLLQLYDHEFSILRQSLFEVSMKDGK